MQRRRLRELIAGAPPDPTRVFFTSLWFKGHNNPRYGSSCRASRGSTATS